MRILALLLPLVALLCWTGSARGAAPPRIALEIVGPRAVAIREAVEDALPEGVEVADPEPFRVALEQQGVDLDALAATLASKSARRRLVKRVRRAIVEQEIAAALFATLKKSSRGSELVLLVVDADGVVVVDALIPYRRGSKEVDDALERELGWLADAESDELEPREVARKPPKRAPKRARKDHRRPPADKTSEDDADHAVWLGASIVQDATLAAGEDLCTKESQLNEGFVCFRAQGSQYHGTPLDAPTLELTPAIATTRLLIALEIPTGVPLTVGARVGYSLRGGPTPDGGNAFIPFYGEGRLSLTFAGEPMSGRGPGGFVFASGGVAQLDAAYSVDVEEDLDAPKPASQLDNPPEQELTVWKKTGPGFAAVGIGAFIPTGSFHGVLLELKGMVLFPEVGGGLALGAGYLFGI